MNNYKINKIIKLEQKKINLGDGRFWGGSLPLPAGWLSASFARKIDISNSTLPCDKNYLVILFQSFLKLFS